MLRRQFTTRAEKAEQTSPDPTARCVLCTLGAFLSTERAMNNFQGDYFIGGEHQTSCNTHTHSERLFPTLPVAIGYTSGCCNSARPFSSSAKVYHLNRVTAADPAAS